MNTCGTCKYFGEEVMIEDFENFDTIGSGYHKCDLIKHDKEFQSLQGFGAMVEDGSGYRAALKVEADFGCVKWSKK